MMTEMSKFNLFESIKLIKEFGSAYIAYMNNMTSKKINEEYESLFHTLDDVFGEELSRLIIVSITELGTVETIRGYLEKMGEKIEL